MTLHIKTPLLKSQALSRKLGREVWLKMEALQPCGSFKLRGVGAVCELQHAAGVACFISSSGGNAGIAVAYCGKELGVPVVVVVPETTSDRARSLILAQGAELIVHGATWSEANNFAKTLIGTADAFVHPFDDPVMWSGHASMIDEMASEGRKPDLVVFAVGGGGLLCGVLEGLHRNGWADVPVVAIETVGADSYAQSVAACKPVELPAISSIATSLGARRPCDQALAWADQHKIHNIVVTDAEAVSAAIQFKDDQRVVVEPACGAALAALYTGHPAFQEAQNIAVIVCGGTTTTVEQLENWERSFLGNDT